MREGFVKKRCPKCGGNVYLDRDYHGWYEQCLQCGYIRNLQSIVEVKSKVSQGELRQAVGNARVK